MKRTEIQIGEKSIGPACGVYIIAEAGINHDGKVEQAHKLVDAAADAGADAVKFQTFRADRLMVPVRERLAQQGNGSESAFEMFRRMELSWEDHENLKRHADERALAFLSTPFDEESADFLHRLGVPAFKIASSDITHAPLLKHVGAKGRPVILSTGMSFLNEVAEALWALKSSGARDILLMHCVSLYPAPPETVNLRAILTLRNQFDLLVGYSDHTQGTSIALAAAVLGAVALEKHLTLDNAAPGPDHKLSLDPADLSLMIRSLREIESALGDGRKRPASQEAESRALGRRSIVSSVDIRAQEIVAPWMLACKRPAGGIEPKELDRVIGMRARHNISRDTILAWHDFVPTALPDGADESGAMESKGSPVPSPQPIHARKTDA